MQFLTTTAAALALLAGGASAKRCVNMTVPVTVSARQGVYSLQIPQVNVDVPDFVLNVTKQGSNFTNNVLTGFNTVMGRYNISTQFCTPNTDNATAPVVQVLTHGIGFDKTYWDLPFKAYNYSYVDYATNQGYSTLSYDRLGIGNSSHGEPLNEIQAPLEIAALYALTSMLRNGTFPASNRTFSKVVHVGHSFGSAQTYALANMYPTASDGLILTGFSMNSSFVPFFAAGANFQLASLNQPLRFSNVTGAAISTLLSMYAEPLLDYVAPLDLSTLPRPQGLPAGYLVSSNAEANKYLFLKPKAYDPAILTLAERTKQPVTLGELLTLGVLPMTNAFRGPVLVFTGDSDLPYCGGDCVTTGNSSLASIPAAVAKNFPNVAAANFTAYIQPNTGHGLTLHYNATGGYRVMNSFLASHGLASR